MQIQITPLKNPGTFLIIDIVNQCVHYARSDENRSCAFEVEGDKNNTLPPPRHLKSRLNLVTLKWEALDIYLKFAGVIGTLKKFNRKGLVLQVLIVKRLLAYCKGYLENMWCHSFNGILSHR